MPASNAFAAFGTLFKLGDGANPENFTTLAEVTKIAGPGGKSEVIDVTNHSSPNAFKEIVIGTIDPGTFKLTVNFVPTAVTQGYTSGMLYTWTGRNKRNFQLLWPNTAGTYLQFAGYVTDFDQTDDVDGKVEATFSVELTGPYAWTN